MQVKATLADGVLTVLTPKIPDVKDLTGLAGTDPGVAVQHPLEVELERLEHDSLGVGLRRVCP